MHMADKRPECKECDGSSLSKVSAHRQSLLMFQAKRPCSHDFQESHVHTSTDRQYKNHIKHTLKSLSRCTPGINVSRHSLSFSQPGIHFFCCRTLLLRACCCCCWCWRSMRCLRNAKVCSHSPVQNCPPSVPGTKLIPQWMHPRGTYSFDGTLCSLLQTTHISERSEEALDV